MVAEYFKTDGQNNIFVQVRSKPICSICNNVYIIA